MEKMKLYTSDEVKDDFLGVCGTPERDTYEQKVDEALPPIA